MQRIGTLQVDLACVVYKLFALLPWQPAAFRFLLHSPRCLLAANEDLDLPHFYPASKKLDFQKEGEATDHAVE